ncbi:MAG TPA: amidase [Alphaproteobacteria bacterium]|nr:amidase [Alphaproteobacteria bacterium]
MTNPAVAGESQPNNFSASEAARRIARGELSSIDLVEACLTRIAKRERTVGAWQHLDPDSAREMARTHDAEAPRGALHGVPVGIKDIFDTADMPTTYGSDIYRHNRPSAHAAAVELLVAAGAIVLGKTVSTEFAYFTPGKTSNPHNRAHTPGGSSSGSAAAVADYMVPLAIGSQTAGSVIRPAAFCGVIGFKPSHGVVSMMGAKPFAPSLDTVGTFSRSVEDTELIARVLMGDNLRTPDLAVERPRRIGICRTEHWREAGPATVVAMDTAAAELQRHGVETVDLMLPEACQGLTEAQHVVMAFEARLSYAVELRDHASQLSQKLLDFLEESRTISEGRYSAALQRTAIARAAFDALLEKFDLVMTPSAPGEAPLGLNATGDPIFNRLWTLLHVPCVTIPFATGPHGLPIGLQFVGRFKHDRTLLALVRWIEAELS